MIKRIFSVWFFILAIYFSLSAVPAEAWSGRSGWVFKAQAPFSSSVAAADGLVIAGDVIGNLYAIHAASGKEAWCYTGTNSIVGKPAIADGMVVFSQANGTVTALSLKTGSLLWHVTPSEGGYGSESVSDGAAIGDGKVFFSKSDGKLYALKAENGQQIWTFKVGLDLSSAPAYEEGLLLLGDMKGIFSAIDPKSGKRLWGGGAGSAVNTPTAQDGHVFFSSYDGTVQSVRIKGVIPQWKTNVGAPISTPPFIGGDKIVVGTGKGNVVALDKKSGKKLWEFSTNGGSVLAKPLIAEGLVFAAGGQGTLFVLNAADGAERFTFPTGDCINGTPAFMGGVLFLASTDGNLYAIY